MDIVGQISHDADPEAVAVILEGPPLAEEKILAELLLCDQCGDLLDVRPQGPDPPVVKLPRPSGPGLSPKERLEGAEEGILVQPMPFISTEGLVIVLDTSPAGRKPLPGQAQDSFLKCGREPEIDVAMGKTRRPGQVAPAQKTLFDQSLGADDQRIPRKGRRTAVGGISHQRIRRDQWEDLPETLPGTVKEIGKPVGLGPQIADTEPGRQGCHM